MATANEEFDWVVILVFPTKNRSTGVARRQDNDSGDIGPIHFWSLAFVFVGHSVGQVFQYVVATQSCGTEKRIIFYSYKYVVMAIPTILPLEGMWLGRRYHSVRWTSAGLHFYIYFLLFFYVFSFYDYYYRYYFIFWNFWWRTVGAEQGGGFIESHVTDRYTPKRMFVVMLRSHQHHSAIFGGGINLPSVSHAEISN